MRIALVVDDFHGGSGNIAQLMALNFNEEHDVSMVLTNLHSEPRYNLNGIKIYDPAKIGSHSNKALGLFSLVRNIGRILKKEIKAELIISFVDNNNTMVCLSNLFNKTPIIVAERSNPLVIFPKKPWDTLRRIAYRRANVVTVQFDIFKNFDGGRFADKVRVTSNIVKKAQNVKNDWKSGKTKFVTCGRLANVKRMDLMIELFESAQKKCPDIELHIFGDGPNREKLQNLIAEKNLESKVFLRGYCDDVHNTLLDYDAYLMTSKQEGFPNSLCEAMAIGLPSVSFACHEGITELAEFGESGFAVPDGDKDAFVEKMILLANDEPLRESMGKNAMKISERYSNENIMKQWYECITDAMKKSKK